ncbi:hypothetical protein [Actinomadura nitritigenes]|uniref:hypothetical protein n=1 Tax=Actinomadura nitritigenes TaxID=134602 RepID=UPI003D8AFF9A
MTAQEGPVEADMVLTVTPITRARAEKIAAYANHRFAGLLPVDAATEVGILADRTRNRYERVVGLLVERFDLPELPRAGAHHGFPTDFERGRESANHQKHHGAAPRRDCRYCEQERGAVGTARGDR